LPSPIFVRKDLDPVIKKKIQKAYIDMKKTDPAAWAVISKQYMNDIEYIEISDKDYQYFRDIANKIDDLGIKY
jgi:phosphonate transport system substrate-binding protein